MATETNLEKAVKRVKEEIGSGADGGGSYDDVSKKRKRETDDVGEKENTSKKEEEEEVVWLGSVKFQTSREIFTYFDTLSRSWLSASDFNVIGNNRRVFYFTMNGTAHEFCFRSCVDNILALPDDLKEQDTGAVCKCHVPSPEPNEEEVILEARELDTSAKVYVYCFNLLYYFPPLNKPISKHDRLVLLELVKKWDPPMWENKFGCGSEVDQYSFEVRIHPMYVHSTGLRSFFIVDQRDGSAEEFCFIKLAENICPLPQDVTNEYTAPCTCHRDKRDARTLGIRKFPTSEEMFDYFQSYLLCVLPSNTPILSEVFRTAAMDLVRRGDPELGKKIGLSSAGFESYSVKVGRHPVTNEGTYFLVTEHDDGFSMDPFWYWKCIDSFDCRDAVAGRARTTRGRRAAGGARTRGRSARR